MITDNDYARILADGVRLWNEHKFFECHDKLEEAWKAVKHEKKREPAADPRRDLVHGVILLAVAYHHWRNQNFVGAQRKFEDGLGKLAAYPDASGGIHVGPLRAKGREHLGWVVQSAPFRPEFVPRLVLR